MVNKVYMVNKVDKVNKVDGVDTVANNEVCVLFSYLLFTM